MDPVDQAFVESLVPEGSMIEGYVAAVAYMTPEGRTEVRIHYEGDLRLSEMVGMCEMAKMHVFRQITEGDDGD